MAVFFCAGMEIGLHIDAGEKITIVCGSCVIFTEMVYRGSFTCIIRTEGTICPD